VSSAEEQEQPDVRDNRSDPQDAPHGVEAVVVKPPTHYHQCHVEARQIGVAFGAQRFLEDRLGEHD
jgi:hypothetical protein